MVARMDCSMTPGGALPDEVFEIVAAVRAHLPDANLGIHCHNDAGVCR